MEGRMKSKQVPTYTDNEAVHYMLPRVVCELRKAEAKHPDWPVDCIHAAAILAEESGEVVQAALQYVYEGGSKENIIKELAQTGAMVFRMMNVLLEEVPSET
jgi:NTP pyrophosphatase (non-canonical NTP hydrolase)